MSENQENDDDKTVVETKMCARRNKEANVYEKCIDLDDVLANELGQFGWFQLRNVLLVAVPVILCGCMSEFIFTAATIPHRCRIAECGEDGKLNKYDPKWISNAVPNSSLGLASCERYAVRDNGTSGTKEYCPADLFNHSKSVACEGFVYARDNTVVYEFDLGCKEWLRVMAGTAYSVGTLFALPITGYISDRFGRRTALIINVFNMGLIGILRAFSVNYTMYLVLQFLGTAFGGGAYSSAYIFVTELVGPDYRVLISACSIAMFAIGEVVLGSTAWLLSSWRYVIMAIHIPCFLIVVYYWILAESVRWLLSKNKYTEAKDILETVARVNKTHISDKSLVGIMNHPTDMATPADSMKLGLVRTVMNSPVLLRRVCTTPVWWMTTTLIFYGLSINSTSLSHTIYLNYILTCAIEIPGYFTAVFILNRLGRKFTMSSGFLLSSACNLAFAFTPSAWSTPRLVLYLLGKFGIAIVATSIYLYTSELYPTEFRHTLLGFSSMIGRIGAILAPLTPVLMAYWHGIPSLLFGCMGIVAGLLVLTQPETLGTKMPDTLAEAEAIGKPDSKTAKPI